MTIAWEHLPWDSEFFGVPVARADLDGATPESLAQLGAELRDAGMRCTYGLHDPADLLLSAHVQAAGWQLVEMLSRFQLDPDDDVTFETGQHHVRLGTEADVPHLLESVATMAPWSRYAVDPNFGIDAARRMHVAWVERAAKGREDHEHHLLVAEDDDGIKAFLSRRMAPDPIIETIGTVAPGSGAPHALLADSRTWAGGKPLSAGWAPARNVQCFRSFGRFGFRVAEVKYQYHLWLDGDR
jgi:hypothetical protein